VPRYHEVEGNGMVMTIPHSPEAVSKHSIIFILTTAVVSMEMAYSLAKPKVAEIVVKHADHGIGSFPSADPFID
jgi:hypothetical protein